MITCRKCQHRNPLAINVCENCGAPLLIGETTDELAPIEGDTEVPNYGSARLVPQMYLVLQANEPPRKTFTFAADGIMMLTLGRSDERNGVTVDVDLSPCAGLERGVSRQHARIVQQQGVLSVVDLGSANGTFLNGAHLIPDQPRVLRHGDQLRLSHLVMTVMLKRADA
jgi:hypothetical protein